MEQNITAAYNSSQLRIDVLCFDDSGLRSSNRSHPTSSCQSVPSPRGVLESYLMETVDALSTSSVSTQASTDIICHCICQDSGPRLSKSLRSTSDKERGHFFNLDVLVIHGYFLCRTLSLHLHRVASCCDLCRPSFGRYGFSHVSENIEDNATHSKDCCVSILWLPRCSGALTLGVCNLYPVIQI